MVLRALLCMLAYSRAFQGGLGLIQPYGYLVQRVGAFMVLHCVGRWHGGKLGQSPMILCATKKTKKNQIQKKFKIFFVKKQFFEK